MARAGRRPRRKGKGGAGESGLSPGRKGKRAESQKLKIKEKQKGFGQGGKDKRCITVFFYYYMGPNRFQKFSQFFKPVYQTFETHFGNISRHNLETYFYF